MAKKVWTVKSWNRWVNSKFPNMTHHPDTKLKLTPEYLEKYPGLKGR